MVNCYLLVRSKLTSTLAKICNNGNLETMKVPAGYESPRGKLEQCTYQVRVSYYCSYTNSPL